MILFLETVQEKLSFMEQLSESVHEQISQIETELSDRAISDFENLQNVSKEMTKCDKICDKFCDKMSTKISTKVKDLVKKTDKMLLPDSSEWEKWDEKQFILCVLL